MNNPKKLLTAGTLCLVLMAGVSRAQLALPQPSPGASVSQKVGLSEVAVSYSRPAAKGRKIFGDLLPFGKLWRTGANAATKVTFGEGISLEGKAVPAGDYSLFTIPGANEWTVILNKNPKVSAAEYKQEEDLLRLTVKPGKTPVAVESFTIGFGNVTPNSADLEIAWENTLVRLKLTAEVDSRVMAQIKEKVLDVASADPGLYYQAASYYFETGKDPKQALAWVNKATATDPKYWMMHLKAKLQAKNKDYAGAMTSAKQSIELAKVAKNEDYVRLNERLMAEVSKMK